MYYCDEGGENQRNLSKHLSLQSVLNNIKLDGWEIVSVWRSDMNHITYTLQSVEENKGEI